MMRRTRQKLPVLLAIATFLWLTPIAVRVDADEVVERKVGFLIPSQCKPVDGMKGPEGPYDEWPAPHTTECALRKGCIESGYGLWVMDEKTFYQFDGEGQQQALDYFRTTVRTSYNKVAIVGDFRDAEATRIVEMNSTD